MTTIAPTPTGLGILDTASVGAPITRGYLSLYPVYLHGKAAPAVEPGNVALAAGRVSVEEHRGVNLLLVTSLTDRPVLFPEGDILMGGKQNRTLNMSVLIPAGGTTELPVSCVESGRWGESTDFGPSMTHAPRKVRRAKAEYLRMGEGPGSGQSDQGRVWQEIEAEFSRTGGLSASRSVDAAVNAARAGIEALGRLHPLPDQVGTVATRGRRILGLDVFASTSLLEAYWGPILRSYAGELSHVPPSTGAASVAVVVRALRHLAMSVQATRPGIGAGTDHIVRTEFLVGSGISLDGCLIHASAFGRAT